MKRSAIMALAAISVLVSLVVPVTAKDAPLRALHDPDIAYVGPSWPDGAAATMVDWEGMSATLTWPAAITGDAPLGVYVISRNGNVLGGMEADEPRSLRLDHLPDTVYQYTIVARDENFVLSEPLVLNFSTGTGMFWPHGAQGTATPLSNSSTRIEWPEAMHTDGEIASYRIAFQDLGQVFAEVDASTRSYTFDGLTVGGHYFVGITAVDVEGATSTQLVRPFFQVSPPYWPNGSELTATAIDSYFVHLAWPHAVDDYEEVVSYSIRRDGVQIALISSTNNAYVDSGRAEGTEYHYEIVAYDENNVGSLPLSAVATTGVGPFWNSLSGIELVTRSSTSTEIYWPEAVSQGAEIVLYEIDLDGEFLAAVPPHLQNYAQSLVIEGLQAGQSYLVELWALDDRGLWSRPLPAQFIQMSGNGPSWPTGATLTASSTSDSVELSWPTAIAGDRSVVNYEVWVDGIFLGSLASSERAAVVTGLDIGTQYHFGVRAMDEWNLTTPFLEVSASTIDVRVGAFDPATGEWHLRGPDGSVASFYFGNPGDFPFMGDWNCNGVDTPGLYRQSDGFVYLRNTNSQGNAHITFFFGNPGDIPIAGDFNGNGCDTVSIYRPSNQTFYIVNQLGQDGGGLGAAQFSYVFGNPGDKPFVGDFNGNGVDTVGLHRESSGLVYFRNSHTQGNADAQFVFGNPGDRLIAGDWGIVNGIDTPALFRPGNTTWYFRHTNTQGNADAQFFWGQSQWIPVSGWFGPG